MKKIIIASFITLFAVTAGAAEMKKVCHDKVVKGKTTQQCKTIKVHRKFEGTKISDTKPDTVVKKPVAKKSAPAAKRPVAKKK